jgi:queuosine precursor transporter
MSGIVVEQAAARRTGGVAFLAFLATIPLANWMIGHVGTVCAPNGGPCLVPVAPGLLAPSGVIAAGAALVLRDVVQRCLGLRWSLFAILAGAAVSALVAPRAVVLASTAAFLLSELADLVVYTPLQQRRLVLAVILSACCGLMLDSVVFLFLAFGSLDFLAGQVVGKAWAVLVSIPLIRLLRRVAPTPA